MRRIKINKSRRRFGLFLFFLAGLFALQIAFAFTTHGDIGPHRDIVPGVEQEATPVLIGRIDNIINDLSVTAPVKVVPEAALAPAVRYCRVLERVDAKIDAELLSEEKALTVKKTNGERFAQYRVCRGDTLEKISIKLFGSKRMVSPLVRINRITNEKALRLGSVIKVPCTGLLAEVKVEQSF